MTIDKLLLPVGRLVWGNPAKPQNKVDYHSKQPVIKDGKQVEEWICGIAIPKADFEQKVWPYLYQEASTVYPNGVPQQFSWKYKDGDGVDKKGVPYSKREGWAGCYVLTISTEAFTPPIFKFEHGAYRQLAANEIKCGDYLVANVTFKVHPNKDGGIYVNPNAFELVGYGNEIVSSGADAQELFKGQTHQLPPGASAVPTSSAPTGASMPGMGQPTPMAGMPAPAHDFVANAGMPSPQPNVGAAPMQQHMSPQMGTPVVTPVQTYPSNTGMPTSPQQVAAPSVVPQQPMGNPTAMSATTYPSNPVPPGMPQAR